MVGIDDVFVAVYGPDLKIRNLAVGGGPSGDDSQALAVAADGSVVLAGYFYGSITFGAGTAAEITLTSPQRGLFVVGLDPELEPVWGFSAEAEADPIARAVALQPDGSGCVGGRATGPMHFATAEGLVKLGTASPDWVGWVARFEADGTVAWARAADGGPQDMVDGVAADGAGNCLVGGFSPGAVLDAVHPERSTVPADEGGGFVASYAADGSVDWLLPLPSAETWAGPIAVTDDGFVVSGSVKGEMVLDEGLPTEARVTELGSGDVFVARFDASRRAQWLVADGRDQFDRPMALAVAPDGDVVVGGLYVRRGTMGRGTAAERYGYQPGASYAYGGFFARYGAGGVAEKVRMQSAAPLSGEGTGEGHTYDVDVLPSGRALAVGHFSAKTTWGGGDPDAVTLAPTPVGGVDAFVLWQDPE